VIYDKLEGEFASRSLTYVSKGTVRFNGEVTSVVGPSLPFAARRVTAAIEGRPDTSLTSRNRRD